MVLSMHQLAFWLKTVLQEAILIIQLLLKHVKFVHCLAVPNAKILLFVKFVIMFKDISWISTINYVVKHNIALNVVPLMEINAINVNLDISKKMMVL
jgi:hypothetical protein